jgi:hypothetical protein
MALWDVRRKPAPAMRTNVQRRNATWATDAQPPPAQPAYCPSTAANPRYRSIAHVRVDGLVCTSIKPVTVQERERARARASASSACSATAVGCTALPCIAKMRRQGTAVQTHHRWGKVPQSTPRVPAHHQWGRPTRERATELQLISRRVGAPVQSRITSKPTMWKHAEYSQSNEQQCVRKAVRWPHAKDGHCDPTTYNSAHC